MFIPCSSFCFLSCILCLPLAQFFSTSPKGLDKYSFFLFLLSDEDSLHLSLTPFIFSCFCVFIYHAAYLSCFLPLSVSCYLFVFPFSFCHHKLPVLSLSPPQRSTLSIHMSPSSASISHLYTLFSILLLLICPSIPLSLLHKQQGVYSPPGCIWCHGEACLVAAGSFHHCRP